MGNFSSFVSGGWARLELEFGHSMPPSWPLHDIDGAGGQKRPCEPHGACGRVATAIPASQFVERVYGLWALGDPSAGRALALSFRTRIVEFGGNTGIIGPASRGCRHGHGCRYSGSRSLVVEYRQHRRRRFHNQDAHLDSARPVVPLDQPPRKQGLCHGRPRGLGEGPASARLPLRSLPRVAPEQD